jgi:hypothetical protein
MDVLPLFVVCFVGSELCGELIISSEEFYCAGVSDNV